MNGFLMNLIISVISSVLSGGIMVIIQNLLPDGLFPNSILIIISVLILIVVYLFMMFWSYRSLGIRRILNSSVKGEGSPKAYMKLARQSISFMGIASSKWLVDIPSFEKMIRRICSLNGGSVRLLLLNPVASATSDLSMAQGQKENTVRDSINKSLSTISKAINSLRAELANDELLKRFEIRLYNQTPVYRLTIIDKSRAYLSFYRIGSDGSEIRQLVIYPTDNVEKDKQNVFGSLAEYFETIWNDSNTKQFDFDYSANLAKMESTTHPHTQTLP